MSKFRSKLARYNTIHCDQVMPVPVIPICAIACRIPIPICEYKPTLPITITTTPAVAAACLIDNTPYTPYTPIPAQQIVVRFQE